jgi:hypothetical protein
MYLLLIKMKKTKNKHRWDETMVIAVMIVSVLCILFMLASYVNVTGKAASSAPTKIGVQSLLNSAIVFEGTGEVICNTVCAKNDKTCILSKEGSVLKACGDKLSGEYSCLCTSNK